jgi:hypothetical protein
MILTRHLEHSKQLVALWINMQIFVINIGVYIIYTYRCEHICIFIYNSSMILTRHSKRSKQPVDLYIYTFLRYNKIYVCTYVYTYIYVYLYIIHPRLWHVIQSTQSCLLPYMYMHIWYLYVYVQIIVWIYIRNNMILTYHSACSKQPVALYIYIFTL